MVGIHLEIGLSTGGTTPVCVEIFITKGLLLCIFCELVVMPNSASAVLPEILYRYKEISVIGETILSTGFVGSVIGEIWSYIGGKIDIFIVRFLKCVINQINRRDWQMNRRMHSEWKVNFGRRVSH